MSDLLKGLAPWPSGDYSVFGPVEETRLSKMQRYVAANVGRNWLSIPHVTHQDDADITELEAIRKAHNEEGGIKLSVVPFLMKALASALSKFPNFNVSIDPARDMIVQKKYIHVGFAADTGNGLLLPVIRNCDQKSVVEIAIEMTDLVTRAKARGLSMDEMSGGCITVTSLGHIGGTSFTPIVNAPEVAILGVTRARPLPRPASDGGVEWRTMLPLSLSYDHRVINGTDAAYFTRFLADLLANPASFPLLQGPADGI
jgi:pyruvate dehydrogenase E2 component (dihydrolipoamide acetyltransferase)